MHVTVIGAGVTGLACAVELAQQGAEVEVVERSEALGVAACAWQAGGMLAPWCERESAEPLIAALGEESLEWWSAQFSGTVRRGTLVVAHGRDLPDLAHFASRTERYTWLDRDQIAALEPDLGDRFGRALFFPSEGHLDPRAALHALAGKLIAHGGRIRFGAETFPHRVANARRVIDCRGLAARDVLTDLRGVRGEMLVLRSRDVRLTRPVRLLHPRIPLYIVPRGDGLYMIGATMIESDEPGRITARSALELLSAAYALHPAFAEAEIIEASTGVRPAFADNRPRIRSREDVLYVNGLYRHGFLLAPALARIAADAVLHGRFRSEVMDEDPRQRRFA